MDDLTRLWTDLIGRLSGPMSFRFVLQPAMGFLFAAIDGFKDAHEGRPPYFWAILAHPEERGHLLQEGWRREIRVLTLGVVMEVIYQLTVFHWIYPVELILVVLAAAFLPYLLSRGPFNRMARRWTRPTGSSPQRRA